MRDRLPLAGLPPAARWSIFGALGLVVLLAVGVGVWALLQHREASAREAFASAAAGYRTAVGEGAETSQVAEAAQALRQFVSAYPRSAQAATAWYYLGNLEYRRGGHVDAIGAFEEAARRDRGSIGTLSRLGAGYAWEAKPDPRRALAAYEEGLKGRGPKDFQYVELLLGVARSQEQLKQPAAAIETYRRLIKEVPDSPRAEEARARLAVLGAGAA